MEAEGLGRSGSRAGSARASRVLSRVPVQESSAPRPQRAHSTWSSFGSSLSSLSSPGALAERGGGGGGTPVGHARALRARACRASVLGTAPGACFLLQKRVRLSVTDEGSVSPLSRRQLGPSSRGREGL